MNDQATIKLLEDINIIAVVGLSPKPNRPSHRVAKHLQAFSYTVIPVRPGVSTILDQDVYESLEAIPFKVDLVNVFRAPKFIPAIVDSCINVGINKIWLQEGIISSEAEKKSRQAGISMVMNRCIYKEIIRLGLDQTSKQ
jgi:predicted CoA-binding protein|tara:strand:- start:1534 stop:1953 length:420 start_codon:yes stop_codon:yes gene_type:complete